VAAVANMFGGATFVAKMVLRELAVAENMVAGVVNVIAAGGDPEGAMAAVLNADAVAQAQRDVAAAVRELHQDDTAAASVATPPAAASSPRPSDPCTDADTPPAASAASSAPAAPPTPPTTPSSSCVICMERPNSVAFVPCGHTCYCEQCAEAVDARAEAKYASAVTQWAAKPARRRGALPSRTPSTCPVCRERTIGMAAATEIAKMQVRDAGAE